MRCVMTIIALFLAAGCISAESTSPIARTSEAYEKGKSSMVTDVLVSTSAGSWTYTIHNGEQPNSHRYISYLWMDIDGPVSGAEAPKGWKVAVSTVAKEVPIF